MIRHKVNRGHGIAVSGCLRVAVELGADVSVVLDAVKHDPAEIRMLVDPILEGKADISVRDGFKTGQKTFAAFSREAIEKLGISDEEEVEMDEEILRKVELEGLQKADVRHNVLESVATKIMRKPFVFFGLPGLILSFSGASLGALLLLDFLLGQEFSIGATMVFLLTLVTGVIFLCAAGILNAILNLNEHRKDQVAKFG